MKYLLDSVKREDIAKWNSTVDGVTSNPILLKEQKMTNLEFLKSMTGYSMSDKKIFIQITDIEEAFYLKNESPLNIIFKVTMHPKYYPLIKKLKDNGYQVAATTMYDIVQINQAIEFGCDYTMVYFHKNTNKLLFEQAYKLKQITGSKIKLVGASFRNKQEVEKAILNGMDYSTVRPEHLEVAFKNEQLESDLSVLYA